jgi:hypothetical protein
MNMIIKIAFIILFVSCETNENIEVSIDAQPIQFNLTVPIDPLEVEDQFSEIEDVDVIGGVFGELAEMMANAEIEQGELGNFAFSPCLYEISEIDKVDFDYVRSITLNNITMKIESSDPDANFDFVEFAQAYIRPLNVDEFDFLQEEFSLCTDMQDSSKEDEEVDYWNLDVSDMSLAFSYEKSEQAKKTAIQPTVHLSDWRQILEKKHHLLLFFRVKIDKVPDYDFRITGDIDLNIDIDLKSN